ncbi:4-hydroxybenzoyl-CoA thioesterase domain protein [Candidatus Burkholderia verschuerenii]|uniref:4-hydroxybenzoyl-CoA thioesterase domain protein n=1 Tax=Candidatus Burkholderia verschuerenii TaxID=242163 RepID=A0A0L0MIX2_9BURK|nr:thioesterase family protein [Candidatus Burkholderia verschuerenii]KND61944.1 4-hydroxybenzoyl-CoA thioesterase domain protein [Candidatus Burkholderia verschuerenii]
MTDASILSACTTIEVPFHDVDSMRICWHGNYLKYFEFGRAALQRVLDYDHDEMEASGYVWPIVECKLKFVRSARYGQRLEVEAALVEYENRLKIEYRIRDSESGAILTKGYTTQVALNASTGELQYVSPEILFEKVARAEANRA